MYIKNDFDVKEKLKGPELKKTSKVKTPMDTGNTYMLY